MARWTIVFLFALLLLGCSQDPSADVVGTWSVHLEGSTLPEGNPAQRMAAQMMLSTARVEIREDGTFSLNLMASAQGSWKYDGTHLFFLTEGKEFTRLAAASPSGEIQLDVFPEKGQLVWPMESPMGKMKLVLVRAPAEVAVEP